MVFFYLFNKQTQMTSGTSLNMDYLGSQLIYEQLDKDKKRRKKDETLSDNATPQKLEQKPDTIHEAIEEIVQNEENKVEENKMLYYNNPFLHTFTYLRDLAKTHLFNPQPNPDPTKTKSTPLTEPLINAKDEAQMVINKQEAQKIEKDRQKEVAEKKKEHGLSEYIKYGLL